MKYLKRIFGKFISIIFKRMEMMKVGNYIRSFYTWKYTVYEIY